MEPHEGFLTLEEEYDILEENHQRDLYRHFIVTSVCDITSSSDLNNDDQFFGPSIGPSIEDNATWQDYQEVKKKKEEVLNELNERFNQKKPKVSTQDIQNFYSKNHHFNPIKIQNQISDIYDILNSQQKDHLETKRILVEHSKKQSNYLEINRKIFGWNIKGVFSVSKPSTLFINTTIIASTFALGYYTNDLVTTGKFQELIPDELKKIYKVYEEVYTSDLNNKKRD